MWLMNVKESQQFQFFPLMLLMFMLMNFNPIMKLLLFVTQGEDLSFMKVISYIYTLFLHRFCSLFVKF